MIAGQLGSSKERPRQTNGGGRCNCLLVHVCGHLKVVFKCRTGLCCPGLQLGILAFFAVAFEEIDCIFMYVLLVRMIFLVFPNGAL